MNQKIDSDDPYEANDHALGTKHGKWHWIYTIWRKKVAKPDADGEHWSPRKPHCVEYWTAVVLTMALAAAVWAVIESRREADAAWELVDTAR